MRHEMTDLTERYITVFDLDKTLARFNVSFAFGQFLYQRGHIPFFRMVVLVLIYWLSQMRCLSIERIHTLSFQLFFYNKESKIIESEALYFLKEKRDDL